MIYLDRCRPPDGVLKQSGEIVVPPLPERTVGALAAHDKQLQRDVEELQARQQRAEQYWDQLGCVRRDDLTP